MISTHKRLTRIIDELISYFFTLNATNITVQINEQETRFEVTLSCNYSLEKDNKVKELYDSLKTSRQIEMEEYYWELAGECCDEFELSLIGMMIDEVFIDTHDDHLQLIIYKNKS